VTPTPHPSLFDALTDAPEPGDPAHATARADLPAPGAAHAQEAPEEAAREATFDPFKYPDYNGSAGYSTAWSVADLRWKNGRGPKPPAYIHPEQEWLRQKAKFEEMKTCPTS
jgi:hypothetical protein